MLPSRPFMAQFYRIHVAGYRKSCGARLRLHVRDRQTYIIQHHRLMPPPSGRGHDNISNLLQDARGKVKFD